MRFRNDYTVIRAGSITADKLNVSELAAVSTNTGTLSVTGTLTLAASGVFQTASSGARLTITQAAANRINVYNSSNTLIGTLGEGTGRVELASANSADFRITSAGELWLGAGATVGLVKITTGPAAVTLAAILDLNTNDVQNVGDLDADLVLVANGSAAAPSIAVGVTDVGFYRTSGDQLGVVTEGTERFRWDTSGDFRGSETGAPRLTTAAGTASLPAFNFVGDTDTGMYRDSANVLGFSTAGTARLVMSAGSLTFEGNGVWRSGTQSGTVAHTHDNGTSASAANLVAVVAGSSAYFRSTSRGSAKAAVRELTAAEAWPALRRLRPRVFRSKLPADDRRLSRAGFYTEEVREAWRPFAPDGDLYDVRGIAAALVPAALDLEARVTALEAAA